MAALPGRGIEHDGSLRRRVRRRPGITSVSFWGLPIFTQCDSASNKEVYLLNLSIAACPATKE